MYAASLHSPIGYVRLSASDEAVVRVEFCDEAPETAPSNSLLEEAVRQLKAYFEGDMRAFDLPLAPEGTPFQQRVWEALRQIPYGTTTTYLDMALRLGDEKSIRAAAAANGRNPVGIIIPCHRVIGSDGKLVGYAGGLWRKKWLLQHELQRMPQPGGLFAG